MTDRSVEADKEIDRYFATGIFASIKAVIGGLQFKGRHGFANARLGVNDSGQAKAQNSQQHKNRSSLHGEAPNLDLTALVSRAKSRIPTL
ncbi:MAG: hypothetical protein O3B73_01580 [bacterium]|nr:hypothetical protein [bacterium]